MKILYIPSWYPSKETPVAGTFIRSLANDLCSTDFQIFVAHSIPVYSTSSIHRQYSHNDHLIETTLRYPFIPKGLPVFQYLWKRQTIKAWQKECDFDFEEFDIIHSHGMVASFLGSYIAKITNKPHIVSYHFSGFLLESIPKWRLYILKNNKVDVHICPSHSLAERVKEITHQQPIIIPNYVEDIPIKSIDSNDNLFKCLSVMHLEEVKNPILLIDKFSELPKHYTLDIIGSGSMKRKILEKIDQLNLGKRVTLIPAMSRNKLLKIYKNYNLFISTSYVETFGMCILESIAAGVPVVSISHDGPSDFINAKNGVLSQPETLVNDILNINIKNYPPMEVSNSIKSFRKENVLPLYRSLYLSFLKS